MRLRGIGRGKTVADAQEDAFAQVQQGLGEYDERKFVWGDAVPEYYDTTTHGTVDVVIVQWEVEYTYA